MSTVSQGLAEAQLDRDTIRRDAKRNLSHHQDYLGERIKEMFLFLVGLGRSFLVLMPQGAGGELGPQGQLHGWWKLM